MSTRTSKTKRLSSLCLEHFDKRFLRNVDLPDALHSFFSFFLFLQGFAFPGDVAAVAFRGHVFSQGRSALACDTFSTDGCLARPLIRLSWRTFRHFRSPSPSTSLSAASERDRSNSP